MLTVCLALGAGSAGVAAGAQAAPGLPPGWSHAQINVTINGAPHTLVYDRGRIIAVGPSSVTLRERDGSVWTIDVSASTQITIDGQPGSLPQVRRLETATTMSIDGGPATKLTVQIPPGVAAAIAAALARQQERKTQVAAVAQKRESRRGVSTTAPAATT